MLQAVGLHLVFLHAKFIALAGEDVHVVIALSLLRLLAGLGQSLLNAVNNSIEPGSLRAACSGLACLPL